MAADIAPKLNKNANGTMPSLTTIRRARIPAGTRQVKMSSTANFFRELVADGSTKADGDADTDADQFLYLAGTYSEIVTGDGSTDVAPSGLAADEFWYFVPTVVDQVIYLNPLSVG